MKRHRPRWTPLLLLLLSTRLFAGDPPQRFRPVVDRLVDAINKQDFPRIQQDFGKIVLDAFPLSKSQPFFESLLRNLGQITRVDSPRFTPPGRAVFPLNFEKGTLDLTIVLDDEDKIVGLWFLPPRPPIPVLERNSAALRLPFKGKWIVLWGGDTEVQNRHHGAPAQQFAFDFLKVDETGKTHKNDGKQNEDYFAFGSEVLVPADGVVTDVIQGVADNAPGSMNPYSALGNAVFIRHRENEVSVLAHFRQDSIRVKVGDKVKQGQVLGLCGNSGNSSEPHIHYHLQNTTIIQNATGIKCVFDGVVVSRGAETRGEEKYSPVKDDIVSHE